jgi:hypothetical protein
MALIENWLPPSRENWELAVKLFTFFPLVRGYEFTSLPALTLFDTI